MLRASIVGMMAAAAAMLFATSSAQAQRRVDAGVLLCNMGPSIGALVASRQRIECRYTSRTGNRVEHYSGAITRFGFDLGAVIGGTVSAANNLISRTAHTCVLQICFCRTSIGLAFAQII